MKLLLSVWRSRVVASADKKFVNKMSRVIIACQDGGRRSEIAAEMVTGLGYTAIAVIEGGVEEYLKVSPLKDADKKARVARVEQFVGIKYGGTGVTSDQTPGERPKHEGGGMAAWILAAMCVLTRDAAARRRQRVSGSLHPPRGCRGSCTAALRGDCARFNMEWLLREHANTRAVLPSAQRT